MDNAKLKTLISSFLSARDAVSVTRDSIKESEDMLSVLEEFAADSEHELATFLREHGPAESSRERFDTFVDEDGLSRVRTTELPSKQEA